MSTPSSLADEFAEVTDQIKSLEQRFRRTRDSISLSTEDETTFRALLRDGLSLLDESLGVGNVNGREIAHVVSSTSGGFFGGPSLHAVQSCWKLMEAAQKKMRRAEAAKASAPSPRSSGRPAYVSQSRIDELRGLPKGPWDLVRLIRMLEELNNAFERGDFISVSMLVRAIKDHVPPIFGEKNFASVYSQSPSSIKKNFDRLETSMKNISDRLLHVQIRVTESLPAESQVDFRADLDVLLEEIVRVLKA